MRPGGMVALALVVTLAGCTEGGSSTDAQPTDPMDDPDGGGLPPVSTTWTQEGESSADRFAACLPTGPEGCLGYHNERSGQFAPPAPLAQAKLVAQWDALTPAQEELQVTVTRSDTFAVGATGRSPLSLELGDLPPGTYTVTVFFTGPVGVMVDQGVQWTVQGLVAA